MYQAILQSANTEAQFEEMFNVLKSSLPLIIQEKGFTKDDSMWDLESFYIVNHCTLWNNPKMRGLECVIIEKNDQIAVVNFGHHNFVELPECIFRLEDLTKID